MELVAVDQPVLRLGVQVDALVPSSLRDVRGGGETPAGVAEIAARLLSEPVREGLLPLPVVDDLLPGVLRAGGRRLRPGSVARLVDVPGQSPAPDLDRLVEGGAVVEEDGDADRR